MKRVLLAMVLAMSFFCANAQINPWKPVNLTSSVAKGKDVFKKHFKPSAYVSFQLNEAAMKAELRKAPSEKNSSTSKSSLIISVPNSKGQIERFRVVEASSMEAGLAAANPDIRSYSGQGVDNPGSRIRFDMSLLGFHASIMSADRKTFYISCVDKASKSYIVYEREILDAKKYGFDCLLEESINTEIQGKGFTGVTDKNANANTLRIYRLALNLAGELSRAVLADVAPGTDTSTDVKKKAIVLSLANSITTEANTYFENEMNIRLVLINNETDIIYLNPATDPFSTWTPSFTTTTWNTETQTNCTNVIGNANYDIGHMLTYNTEKNNGNAGCIGCVCKTPSGSIGKGRGWNMYGEYQGYYFVVDYWTHEMGHQFGGNHTFTHNYEGTIAQVEPGSGTTIMAYAGITGATDVQSHSDPFFSVMSIQQITDYVQTGTGNTCGTTLALTNNLPTANAGSDYTIPKSTPFVLTGVSTDADAGDVRTYSWEQIDARTSTSNTYPTATSTAGPMFRFFPPVTSLSRSFPRLEVVLDSNNTGKWEVLPSVARTMNFRFIVRDNHNGISANESDDVKVTVSGTAGPFAVTAPNTGVSLTPGSSQTVTWSVNSTNTLSTNVKISMSIDGGQTFPYVLAASTPNDGTETITVPNVNSGACRVKIEAIGNIFFDISNVNFAVGACGTPIGLTATSITGTTATLSWTAVTGATSYDVDYRAVGAGTWTTGAAATTSTSLNLTGLTQGTDYEFRVKTNCSFNNGTFATEVFSTLCSTAPTGLSATDITNSTATLNWSAAAGAVSYQVDFKLSTESIWVKASDAATGTSINIYNLIPGKLYNFRVASNCTAGTSSAFTSSTFTSLCSAAPSGLTASAITASSATLSWSTASGAVSYTVDYKLASSGTWTNAATATTSTSVNLTGLTQGLPYDYRVRANCASGNTTYTTAQFTTLCSVAPSGLSSSAITNSGATVSWSAVTGAASYDVDYKLSSSGTWTNAATATTSTSVNLSGLAQGSPYDYRVRTNCVSGSTSYTSAQFTTLCNIAPSGLASSAVTNSSATISWDAVTGASSYDVDYKLASSGTWVNAATATTSVSVNLSSLNTGVQYDFRVRANCASGSTTYTTNQFNTACNAAPTGLSSASITTSSASLSWDAAGGAVSYDVDYKQASSGTWINAATATASTSVSVSGLSYGTTYDWRVRTNCTVGTSSFASSQFNTAIPACDAPSGLASASVTISAATISWDAVTGAATYDVDYKESSSGTWINAATAATSTSVDLSGLNYNTSYDWRVRTNCTYGNTSGYSQAQFTTAIPACDAPANLLSSSVAESSATVSWDAVGGAATYDVDYKESSSGTWINAAAATASTSVNLSGLNYSTSYDWRVRTNCTYGNTSSYSSNQFTTTTPVCDAPANLASSSISASDATVSWSAVASAASYDVDYKPESSSTWINAASGTTSLSITLTGLAATTNYDWRVRTNCTYGNTSDYSTAQFRTYLAEGCMAPTDLTASNIAANSATVNWSAVSGASSYSVGYRKTGATSWINVASGITATSANITGLADETIYEWRVRTNCASSASVFNASQFTTLISTSCPGKYDTVINNSFASAVSVPVNRDIYGTIEASGDVDYYKFVMNAGGFATISLTNLPKNYNIYVYNSSYTLLDSSTKSSVANETIYRKFGKGTQYVKVVSAAPYIYNASLCYTLNIAPDGVVSKGSGDKTAVAVKPGIQLYPNPAHTSINIATDKVPANAVIKISDVYGRNMMQLKAASVNTKLDISKLKAGTYLVTIVSKEGAVLHNTKFIKY